MHTNDERAETFYEKRQLVFTVLVLLALTAVGAAFVYFYNSRLAGSGGAATVSAAELSDSALGGAVPELVIPFEVKENSEFCLYKDYIVQCSREFFFMYDKDGNEVYKKNIDFRQPALAATERFLLVFDLGGRAAFILEDKKTRFDEKFSSNIINASINKDGCAAVILESSGYRNVVRVFAPLGEKLFDWIVADDYVVWAEVSPASDAVALSRIKTNGIAVKSGLEFLDMKSEPFAAVESPEEQVFLQTSFLMEGFLAAATDTRLLIYNDKQEIVVNAFFDAVSGMCSLGGRSVLAAGRRDGRHVVEEYSPKGQPRVLFETEFPVANMASGGSLAAINTGAQVLVINSGRRVVMTVYSNSEIQYCSFSGNNRLLVVTRDNAELYMI